MRNATFWILWRPDSSQPPTVRFVTQDAAHRAAEKMAAIHGVTFYVMQAVAAVDRQVKLKTTVLR